MYRIINLKSKLKNDNQEIPCKDQKTKQDQVQEQ